MFHRPKTSDTQNTGTDKDVEDKNTPATSKSSAANTNQTSFDLDAEKKAGAEATVTDQKTTSPDTATNISTGSGTTSSTSSTSTFTGKDKTDMTPEQDTNTEDTKTSSTETSSTETNKVGIPSSSSPFQRPETTPRPATPSYGTYNPTPYAASGTTGTTPSAGTSTGGRRLTIGEGITMSGEIESCDHLLVEGTVEAALKGAKVLEISSAGTFYGTVEIEQATIAGRFEGDITISGRLNVKSTGSVTGTITYGELAIEAGAKLDGTLSPLNTSAEDSKTTTGKDGGADFSTARKAAGK